MKKQAFLKFAIALIFTITVFSGYSQNATWTNSNAEASIKFLYARIFSREVDASGLASWTKKLKEGNTLTDVINDIIHSKEYQTQFIDPYHSKQLWGEIITPVYQQLLNRFPESSQVMINHSKGLKNNWKQWITGILNSPEYNGKWGNNGVPGIGYNMPGPGSSGPSGGGNAGNQANKWGYYQICVTYFTVGNRLTVMFQGNNPADAAERYNQQVRKTSVDQSGIVSSTAIPNACQ